MNGDVLLMSPWGKRRAAVGKIMTAIIGGVIIVVTVLVSYSTGLLNENEKLEAQVAAAQDDRNLSSEKMIVTKHLQLSDGENKNIKIRISNDGPIVLAYQYVLLYCLSDGCSSPPGAPLINPSSVVPAPPVAIAPGGETVMEVGPVLDGLVYRVDVITERGNIVTSGECKADLAKQTCDNVSMAVEEQ